jgi:mono/diheme cytochrome c family protein
MRAFTSIFVFLAVPVWHAAYADTWALPTTMTYSSEGDLFRLTVTPGIPGARKSKGKLEKQIKKGQYDLVWEADLSNVVSPVSALVTRDGQYVVTFDNWHSRGHGDNVVVLYGPKGQRIKMLSLSDFVDVALESRLPLSVSSRWWGQGHQLDEKAGVVVLKVGNEGPGFDGKPVNEYQVRIRLKDGKLDGNKAEAQVPSANRTVEKVYLQYCLACHDTTGKGNIVRAAMPEIPDFTSAQWQKSRTDSDLAQSILSGKGKFHPRMADKLRDVDMKQLVSLVRAFQSGQIICTPNPPQVVPITPLNPVRVGSAIFRQYCMVCHGPDGKGAAMRPIIPAIPDFTNPGFHKERSDARMMVSILDGKGTLMPAHRGRFTEEQARRLVDFIRTIRTEALPAKQQKLKSTTTSICGPPARPSSAARDTRKPPSPGPAADGYGAGARWECRRLTSARRMATSGACCGPFTAEIVRPAQS